MLRQKFFTKAVVFICAICAAYFIASFFLGSSEAADRKNRRHRAKSQTPQATGLQSTIDNRQLMIENREPSTAFLHAAPADGECSLSGFVLDYKEKTEVADAKMQARLLTGRAKLLTEYSESDGFYCFSDLKIGKYMITTKKSGYENNLKKVEYKGEPSEVNIYLKCKSSEGCADTSGGSPGGSSGGSSSGSTSGGTTGGGSTSGGTTGGTTGGSSTGGTYTTSSFKDNRDGTVTDSANKLMWQKGEFPNLETYNWYETSGTYDAGLNPNSINVCGALSLAGYSGWRLPTIDELTTLIDTSKRPTIDITYFPNAKSSSYWSSTIERGGYQLAWAVDFYYGRVNSERKFNYLYARCVRGIQ
ncbi:MAG: DUF1566 domain-containing protein [Nitrospinae bacterium]|nr:DUF1566 domain-containing protein [Nitrospinota bacterium]